MGEALAPAGRWADQRPRAAQKAVMPGQPLLQGSFKLRSEGSPPHRIDKVVAFWYLPSIQYRNPDNR